MSRRETILQELGFLSSFTSAQDALIKGCTGPQALTPPIPVLSGFGEFTPISVHSYTIVVTDNANLESN